MPYPIRQLSVFVSLTAVIGFAASADLRDRMSVGLRLDDPVLGLTATPHLNILPRTEAETERIAAVLAPPTGFADAEPFESRPAGAGTVRARQDKEAFSRPSANLPKSKALDFRLGNALFEKLWVSSPASTKASDGLGPLYNARACHRCHINDGRGHPPEGAEDSLTSMVIRVSVPAPEAQMSAVETYLAALGEAPVPARPDPSYGWQIQDLAVQGHRPEGRFSVTYTAVDVALSGGETARLRRPDYALTAPAYGPLHPQAMLSPRVAPPMIGLGLLEAIRTEDILALADPGDADGDGISGRAQVVWSQEFDQPMLGRFGWKAGMPTVREQSAAAFASDIGISTPLFSAPAGDCMAAQAGCLGGPHGDGDLRVHEVDDQGLDLVTLYARNLAVPERRAAEDPQVLRGKAMFHGAGCAACHQPKFVTHRLADRPAQSFQLIWPFSDFLLHDMGPGLADHRPEGRASGREWRTAPLWGIGWTRAVSGHSYFLHDGRARSLLEAILWHGGEAQGARDRVVTMPPEDRAALIRFLESL